MSKKKKKDKAKKVKVDVVAEKPVDTEPQKPANTEDTKKSPETQKEEEAQSVDKSTQPANADENIVSERGTGKKKIPGHIIINKKKDPNAKWYVVHTTSGHEARVAETLRQRVETMGLEDNIFEVLVPTQDRVVVRSGKKQNVKEKIFPGYMLVKLIMDDPTWLAVRTTPGITGFVGAGKTPTPLSGAEVANIQKFVATPAKRFKTKFTKGEAVKITDGPFADFLGSIDEIDEEKGKVKVLVSIFGRETPVELDLLQITKV
jgi:transcriptional antiterminator NusG